ncbi:hypothetical protein C8R44DRAFT_786687 [Mycena epipterygia]|nr:hypothetical protein C8R44DRAFT_786687 [Mycena epipterygia]
MSGKTLPIPSQTHIPLHRQLWCESLYVAASCRLQPNHLPPTSFPSPPTGRYRLLGTLGTPRRLKTPQIYFPARNTYSQVPSICACYSHFCQSAAQVICKIFQAHASLWTNSCPFSFPQALRIHCDDVFLSASESELVHLIKIMRSRRLVLRLSCSLNLVHHCAVSAHSPAHRVSEISSNNASRHTSGWRAFFLIVVECHLKSQ